MDDPRCKNSCIAAASRLSGLCSTADLATADLHLLISSKILIWNMIAMTSENWICTIANTASLRLWQQLNALPSLRICQLYCNNALFHGLHFNMLHLRTIQIVNKFGRAGAGSKAARHQWSRLMYCADLEQFLRHDIIVVLPALLKLPVACLIINQLREPVCMQTAPTCMVSL